jgi:hypothetical protein
MRRRLGTFDFRSAIEGSLVGSTALDAAMEVVSAASQ